MTAQCSCCGTELTSTDRIDFRLLRPEALVGVPDEQLSGPTGGLLVGPDGSSYLRGLLPVQLTGGVEIVFGAWLEISPSDAARAYEIWDNDPEYAKLRVSGTFANVIRPWDDLLGVPVEVEVRDTGELPYYIAHPLLGREWDRDWVLSTITHPIPLPVREQLTDDWSVERTAGLATKVEDRTTLFAGDGRWVELDIYADRAARPVEDFFAAVTNGYPIGEHTSEKVGDELRHAFWLAEGEYFTYHAHVVRPGTMLSVRCVYTDPVDRAWAHHVVNSVR